MLIECNDNDVGKKCVGRITGTTYTLKARLYVDVRDTDGKGALL